MSLLDAFEKKQTITVKRYTNTKDDYGEILDVYTDIYANIPCIFSSSTGRTSPRAFENKPYSKSSNVIFLAKSYSNIQMDDKIVFEGRYYSIDDILDDSDNDHREIYVSIIDKLTS